MKNIYTCFPLILLIGLIVNSQVYTQSFGNPLPVPPITSGNVIDLVVHPSIHNFDPQNTVKEVDLDTLLSTYAYNIPGSEEISYLGPTLTWTQGEVMEIHIDNQTDTATTVHWHGLNVTAQFDGGPHQLFAKGTTWSPFFPVIDSVQTLWYHSHIMDFTTEQIIKGMSGLIIIENPGEDPIRPQLPHEYGLNDFPLILQEKAFNTDSIGGTLRATSLVVSERPGNGPYTVINGVVNAILNVPAQMVRFRVLNGSPRKSFHIGISPINGRPAPVDFETMNLIATDGGYIAQPVSLDSFLMSPGERYEVVIDFSHFQNGDTLYLNNLARSIPNDIINGGRNTMPYEGTLGDAFMAFVVDTSIMPESPVFSLPGELVPYTVDTTNIFRHRTKMLLGKAGSGNLWTIDNQPMDMSVINDTLLVNTKEKWTIVNTTDISHPFHIHKTQFQVIEYTGNTGVETGDVQTYQYPDLPYYMLGYKDNLLVRAGATMTFVARFDSFPDPEIRPNRGYMYHCHILTHEDNSMMHQFVVVDSTAYYGTVSTDDLISSMDLKVFPNPAHSVLQIEGEILQETRVRFFDLMGRLLYEVRLDPYSGIRTLPVSHLPRGMMLAEFFDGEKHAIVKILLIE